MSDTIRQQIVNLIESEMKKITVANGYDSNEGEHVFRCRTGDLEDHELPGLVIWDGEDKKTEHTANKHNHELNIDVEAWCTGNDGEDVDEILNVMIANVEKCVGANRNWGWLAQNTIPVDDTKFFDLRDKVTGVAIIRFVVKFRTTSYNAYTQ
jgi:hypothetical protein